ncbi:hypothetical protein A3709_14915 [Halioglobus sp. HI00S01]|uniref:DUF2069 domain-containing protein n=1 Tax=Halioglobus sp. HI00S01 TaxID=1822214 RepID=UPI0007C33055|nr:DUF2069 domain-containing protein [Halioglobus sp. HI00S01]KZX59574.1 hypothetical protein A3709_14915 [Halioglobus sp. HI00S01]
MSSVTERTRVIVWLSYFVLLTAQVLELWMGAAPWIVWVAFLVPLVVFVPGMWRDNLRSYIWLCFVLLLYFMRLVVALFADPGSPVAISGMVAVVILFISAMMYVRWRARELKEAAATAAGHGE